MREFDFDESSLISRQLSRNYPEDEVRTPPKRIEKDRKEMDEAMDMILKTAKERLLKMHNERQGER